MALEGSLLLCMPDEPGALENQISSKRFGEAVRENCIKEDPPAPKPKFIVYHFSWTGLVKSFTRVFYF